MPCVIAGNEYTNDAANKHRAMAHMSALIKGAGCFDFRYYNQENRWALTYLT
jgi:hypothetical protein